MDLKEMRQEGTAVGGQVRALAALDLREVRLAQAFAQFALHGLGHFCLGHGPSQPAQGALDGAEVFQFLMQVHRSYARSFCYLLYYYNGLQSKSQVIWLTFWIKRV